jgi:hypothetical protein
MVITLHILKNENDQQQHYDKNILNLGLAVRYRALNVQWHIYDSPISP